MQGKDPANKDKLGGNAADAERGFGSGQVAINTYQQAQAKTSRTVQDKSSSSFFGDLEIRGLINLSYYALYSPENLPYFKVPSDVQNRLCKCTVILTREIMTKFTGNTREYQHLLTILLQLLQT